MMKAERFCIACQKKTMHQIEKMNDFFGQSIMSCEECERTFIGD